MIAKAALALIALTGAAAAQEFTLTYASPYSPNHPYGRADAEWIERIEQQTDGRVQIQPFWSRSLITSKEAVNELAAGVSDIAYITPIYATAGYDLLRETPAFFYGYTDPNHVLAVFQQLWDKYPEFQQEMPGVHVLGYNVGTPMHLILAGGPVDSVADMSGLRIRAANDYIPALAAMGAEGVAMPMSDTYPALQRGVLNGVIASYESLRSLSFAEVAKSYVEIPHSRGAYPSRAMDTDVWNALPEDIRAVFDENTAWLTNRNTELGVNADAAGKAFGAEQGVNFISPSPEFQTEYAAFFAENAKAVAARLDAKGLPGSAILADVRANAPEVADESH